MHRVGNANLTQAKTSKNDEFYTQYGDIEKEMDAYLEYDPDVLRGKTVLLPCDNPEWSNFTRYFLDNFTRLGLHTLHSTCHIAGGRGKALTVTGDVSGDGHIDWKDVQWDYLDGDGDFRSVEVTALRDEADVVVTNPPFSLFRGFLAWIVEANKKFLILGNMNAITYKEVFPLIKNDRMWLGATSFNTGLYFRVPDGFVYANSYKFKREDGGVKVSRVPGVCWFTNLDHGRRHQPLQLMTKADNIRYSKHKIVKEVGYQKYDNYDAIEVPFVDATPSDYGGVMGVPISFLDKYCPEQFELLGCSYSYGRPDGWNPHVDMSPTIAGKSIYKRLFIQHRRIGDED